MSTSHRIVVACAPAPHFNPGMHCVDLALDAVLRRHGIGAELDRRVLYTPAELHSRGIGGSPDGYGLPLAYRTFRQSPPSLAAADTILFWGDFLHSRHYRQAVASLMVRSGLEASTGAALQYFDRNIFLAGQPLRVLERAVVFGSCLLTDVGVPEADREYDSLLSRLLGAARHVETRDALSAQRVADIRRSSGVSHLGVDCALLLRPSDCVELAGPGARAVEPERNRDIGVFFARTQEDPALLLGLAERVGEKVGAPLSWLPWFPAPAPTEEAARGRWPTLGDGTSAGSLSRALGALLRCRAVVTDVYHLSVLAWNCGIPAVCVGRGASRFRTAVSDKKKEIFHLMYGIDRLYVFAEHLPILVGETGAGSRAPVPVGEDTKPPTLDEIASALCDFEWISTVQERITRQRQAAESRLVPALMAES